jgi:hypothetical protein
MKNGSETSRNTICTMNGMCAPASDRVKFVPGRPRPSREARISIGVW